MISDDEVIEEDEEEDDDEQETNDDDHSIAESSAPSTPLVSIYSLLKYFMCKA